MKFLPMEIQYLYFILLLPFVFFVIFTLFRIGVSKKVIDYNNLPPKKQVNRKKNSVTYGFPYIFLDIKYIVKRLLNFFYLILAKKIPLSQLRIIMHRCRGTTIGNNVVMSPNVDIDSTFPELVYIGNNVGIGHNAIIIAHSYPASAFTKIIESYSAPTIIEDDTMLGINTIIFPGVKIGEGSIVFAGSVVDSDVEPRTIVRGNPAKVVGKLPKLRR